MILQRLMASECIRVEHHSLPLMLGTECLSMSKNRP